MAEPLVGSGARSQASGSDGRRELDLEFRRLENVALDRALIYGAQEGLTVFLGEHVRQRELDPDLGGSFSVLDRRKHQSESLRVDSPLLTEAQSVEPRAGSNRGKEEIEGRRLRASSPARNWLVGADPEPVPLRIDPNASRKRDFHVPSMAGRSPSHLMQLH